MRRRARRTPAPSGRASSIIRCTSSGTGLVAWMRSTICGPNVRFGTKWLSMTSTCTKSAAAMRASSACMFDEVGGQDAGVDPDAALTLLARSRFPRRLCTRPLWSSRGPHHGAARSGARRGPPARRSGAPASYIPELAVGRPGSARARRRRSARPRRPVGDDDATFTIQSMSKPFVLALALERPRARRGARASVGAEPSGEPFNAISLEAQHRSPREPDGQRRSDRDDRAHPRRRHRRAHRPDRRR